MPYNPPAKQKAIIATWVSKCLQAQLGPAPVPPLGVVPDGVVRAEANPVRNRPVLLGLLRQLLLNLKRLVGRHL